MDSDTGASDQLPTAEPKPTRPFGSNGRYASWRASLGKNVDKQHADIPICLCSFVSGLCDSAAFNAASVFVSMQTGNTIFLALGAASLPSNVPLMWLRALVSIGAFLAGVFCFGQLRRLRPTSKGTLAANFFVQSVFILVAAALAQARVAPAMGDLYVAEQMAHEQRVDLAVLAPLALLAFQFGGQIVSSRQLGFNEVPTNVLTSVYCDLFSDPNLFAPWAENPKRNRRASAVLLMLLGGICGGWLGWSRAGMSAALWIGAGIKFITACAWLGWKVEDTK
jgi:uncharacterized membrane protein YoaK (UPF0700 family)